MKKKIYIFGAGYVGLSNGVLLAQNNDVVMVDINKKRVEQINSRSSPIRDAEFEPILSSGKLNLSAVALAGKDIKTSDFVIVATPTNFDEKTGKFDTSSIEAVLTQLDYYGFKGIIVIRSTVPVGYGFAYTHQDRDTNSSVFFKDQIFRASPSYNAKVAQIFGEAAYTGLNFGSVSIEPYAGLAWMHLSTDDFSNDIGGVKVSTKFESQNLAVSSLGARVKVPFEVGPAKLKAVADVNWTQYMGDTRGKAKLQSGALNAKIRSEKLSAVAAVGVGLEAQLSKRAALGVSYYGAYGGKIKSNGVGATFKLAF